MDRAIANQLELLGAVPGSHRQRQRIRTTRYQSTDTSYSGLPVVMEQERTLSGFREAA